MLITQGAIFKDFYLYNYSIRQFFAGSVIMVNIHQDKVEVHRS